MNTRDSLDRLVQSTYEIGRFMRHQAMSEKREGVHMGQLHALLLISEHPGMTMKELAGKLHITSPSATSLVNRLVTLGWVGRKHDTENRKLVRLRLTAKGSEFLRSKHREKMKAMRMLFSHLSAAEQNALADLHDTLISHIRRQYQS